MPGAPGLTAHAKLKYCATLHMCVLSSRGTKEMCSDSSDRHLKTFQVGSRVPLKSRTIEAEPSLASDFATPQAAVSLACKFQNIKIKIH